MASKRRQEPVWTAYDSALWYTCEIVADLAKGHEPSTTLDILAPFPAYIPDQRFWASGPFELLDLRASGDGSYVHNSGFFFASGAAGMAVTAAAAVGRAAGNNARRSAAAVAAIPRWTVMDRGMVYVTAAAFSLHAQSGLHHWPYTSIEAAQMVAPGQLHLQGQSTGGPISWILVSDWAELIFVIWALQMHPRHPQLVGGGWLPPGWIEHARSQQHPSHLGSAAIQP